MHRARWPAPLDAPSSALRSTVRAEFDRPPAPRSTDRPRRSTARATLDRLRAAQLDPCAELDGRRRSTLHRPRCARPPAPNSTARPRRARPPARPRRARPTDRPRRARPPARRRARPVRRARWPAPLDAPSSALRSAVRAALDRPPAPLDRPRERNACRTFSTAQPSLLSMPRYAISVGNSAPDCRQGRVGGNDGPGSSGSTPAVVSQ